MRTLIGHWLQGNLHAEHFLLVTRPKPPFFVAPEVIGRLDQASKSKPQLVSPMFKGMEGRPMHFIELLRSNRML